jgi:hypothetical protein
MEPELGSRLGSLGGARGEPEFGSGLGSPSGARMEPGLGSRLGSLGGAMGEPEFGSGLGSQVDPKSNCFEVPFTVVLELELAVLFSLAGQNR